MRFEYLEDIATADVAFKAYGKNLNELFENAALATAECMVNTKQVRPTVKKEITVTADNVENLLFDFLSEFIFFKDTERLMFSKFAVQIDEANYRLKATVEGETLDETKHEQRMDVKAVTLHMFEVKQTDEGWECLVILDI